MIEHGQICYCDKKGRVHNKPGKGRFVIGQFMSNVTAHKIVVGGTTSLSEEAIKQLGDVFRKNRDELYDAIALSLGIKEENHNEDPSQNPGYGCV